MATQGSRYQSATAAQAAEGWSIERLTRPSRLHGANGLRTGADGRIYVAQVAGSMISAIDVDSGAIETISPMDGKIVAPDDLVFDNAGNLYITEITEGRVSMLAPDGSAKVLLGDSPVANPITFHQGRLISGECRPGGRILELDRDGGAPRLILGDVPMPNAFAVGPDGKLYMPIMGTNEIWRVDLDGGAPEVVATGLGVPDSVKFDAKGFIVSTQVASGQVLRIDPRTGAKEVLADIGAGLDNCTFVGDRLFVSGIPGNIHEIVAPGQVKPLVEKGLQWPLGLAVAPDGGLIVLDGGFVYTLAIGGAPELVGMLFSPGFPGYARGIALAPGGEWVVTTANGAVARFWPAEQRSEVLADGFDILIDVALHGHAAVVSEYGTGRVLSIEGDTQTVLASGLDKPMGVAVAGDGTVYAAEAGGGRVVKLAGGKAETILDGLARPEGLTIAGDTLTVIDTVGKQLIASALDGSRRRTIASALPVGAVGGYVIPPTRPIGVLAGPMLPFCGLTAGSDGTLYLSGDGEGSVLAIRPL